jgi:hypothetical protein
VLIASVLSAPAGHASYDDRHPDQFVFTTTTFPGGSVGYGFDLGPTGTYSNPSTYFFAADVINPDGTLVASGFVSEYFDDHVNVSVRTDGTTTTIVHTTDPRGCCTGYFRSFLPIGPGSATAKPGATVHLALASWGATTPQFRFLANDETLPMANGDSEHAFLATPFDFSGGVAAAGGAVEGAVASTYQRESHGHLMSLFLLGEAFAGRVVDPAGNATVVFNADAIGGVGTATQTDGVWTYDLDVGVEAVGDDAPALWGVELP